jgi:hypothetical protein
MKCIVGPVPSDLSLIGFKSDNIVLSTAFYSSNILNNLNLRAKNLSLFVRLDLSSIDEWALGMINPDALLRFLERNLISCSNVHLWVSPNAHAKIYAGGQGYLIGSANLTQRGLAGQGDEILWFENQKQRSSLIFKALEEYRHRLTEITFSQLKQYILNNRVKAYKLAKKIRRPETDENRATNTQSSRPKRLGDYADFLLWLDRQSNPAAGEIYARATGKGQLSGHIHRNFYGLRQFLLAHPTLIQRFSKINAARYALSKDIPTAKGIQNFVLNHASDERDFNLDTWRTYLPERCGGKPKTGGGTLGNLNRMLPLVSKYLSQKLVI